MPGARGDHDACRLAALGRAEQPVGAELDPPKRIFFVSPQELAGVPSRRRIPLRLKGEPLYARNLALVRSQTHDRPVANLGQPPRMVYDDLICHP